MPTPMTVLLVEDNPADARLAAEALNEAGAAVALHVSPDGEDALSYLRRAGHHPETAMPDLVLLDLNLPRLSGLELLEIVRNDPRLAPIPVVVLSTSRHDDDVLAAYRGAANAYMCKPVDLQEFFDVMKIVHEFWLGSVRLPTRHGLVLPPVLGTLTASNHPRSAS